MTDPANKIIKAFPPLADDTIIYRGLRKKWINTDEDEVKLDQEAFSLRKDINERNISVKISIYLARELAESRKWNNVAVLFVKSVRALNLDVIQDSNTHAGITGLYEQTLVKEQRLARLLSKCSIISKTTDLEPELLVGLFAEHSIIINIEDIK
jgi:hypothetical protein